MSVLLSGNGAVIGGDSTKPGSSYYALIKAVLPLSFVYINSVKPGLGYYALIKAVLSLYIDIRPHKYTKYAMCIWLARVGWSPSPFPQCKRA